MRERKVTAVVEKVEEGRRRLWLRRGEMGRRAKGKEREGEGVCEYDTRVL